MKRTLDFIVIGAQKAGTTTLFEYLRQHPALALPAEKESPFFSNDDRYDRGMDDYCRHLFAFADHAKLWGTVTPQYMFGGLLSGGPGSVPQQHSPPVTTVPRRIHAACPKARLIAILRDPAERAFSHYRQTVLFGWEQRPFDQAIKEMLGSSSLHDAREQPSEPHGYVVWGEYGRILEPYYDLFGDDGVLALFTEELERDPAELLARIYACLGVEPATVPIAGTQRRARVGATSRRLPWLNLYRAQRSISENSVARTCWHAMPWRTRRRLDRVFAGAAASVDLRNRRRVESTMSPEAAAALRTHFRTDTQRLANLIGRMPPWAESYLPHGEHKRTAGHSADT